MQKIQLSLFLLFLFSFSKSYADDMDFLVNSTPMQRAESQTRFMRKKLGLSEEKAAEIQAINLSFAEMAEPVIKGFGISAIKKYQMKNILDQKDEQLRQVFNAQQFELYTHSKTELLTALKADLSK